MSSYLKGANIAVTPYATAPNPRLYTFVQWPPLRIDTAAQCRAAVDSVILSTCAGVVGSMRVKCFLVSPRP